MWRVRSIMRLFLVYFLWVAVYAQRDSLFGYQKSEMLTYILGVSILQALVLGSRSVDVAGEIATGDLANYLVRPLDYFRYWLTRDLADKLLNLIFVIGETAAFILIFKPPLVMPPSVVMGLASLVSCLLAMLLFFYLSFLVSETAFWYVEHNGWPARFLFTVLVEFISGGYFPLNILPAAVFPIFLLLPTTYLLFSPLQIWLGKVDGIQLVQGLVLVLIWIWVLRKLVKKVWHWGLQVYEAYGR